MRYDKKCTFAIAIYHSYIHLLFYTVRQWLRLFSVVLHRIFCTLYPTKIITSEQNNIQNMYCIRSIYRAEEQKHKKKTNLCNNKEIIIIVTDFCLLYFVLYILFILQVISLITRIFCLSFALTPSQFTFLNLQ